MTIINKASYEEQIDRVFQEIEEILQHWFENDYRVEKHCERDKELGRNNIFQLTSEKEWAMHCHPKHDTPTWP